MAFFFLSLRPTAAGQAPRKVYLSIMKGVSLRGVRRILTTNKVYTHGE
ncbi:hypothetical protein [Prevotella sp.]|nr:hypothetical protein [uncultured Prevotella sp.]